MSFGSCPFSFGTVSTQGLTDLAGNGDAQLLVEMGTKLDDSCAVYTSVTFERRARRVLGVYMTHPSFYSAVLYMCRISFSFRRRFWFDRISDVSNVSHLSESETETRVLMRAQLCFPYNWGRRGLSMQIVRRTLFSIASRKSRARIGG